MKNRGLIIGAVIVALAILGFIFIMERPISKKDSKKEGAVPATKARARQAAAPVKKAISKDKGGLTVKALNSKNKEVPLRIKAFKAVDGRCSIYMASFTANSMYELIPGAYDIEIDTAPQTIYKNIKINTGKETIEELGNITGSINVKMQNFQKKDANYPIRILYAKSNITVTASATNRAIEIVPGLYDLEIGTLPKQVKKDVKVDSGKETFLDLGQATGAITVKAIDENKREVRQRSRILRSENSESLGYNSTGNPIEVLQGTYDVELVSMPQQVKKGVKVNSGEVTLVEFTVETPPQKPPQAKTKK